MAGYTFKRLASAALLLVLVLSFTFFFVHLAPGDPTFIIDDPRLGPEDREALRRIYGLDRPLAEQYLIWMQAVVLEGDWGVSYVHLRPVQKVIAERVPATLLLTGVALGSAVRPRPDPGRGDRPPRGHDHRSSDPHGIAVVLLLAHILDRAHGPHASQPSLVPFPSRTYDLRERGDAAPRCPVGRPPLPPHPACLGPRLGGRRGRGPLHPQQLCWRFCSRTTFAPPEPRV